MIGEFDVHRALVLMYNGPYAAAQVNVLLLTPFQQRDVHKYLMITEVPGDDCHTCKANIDGAIFSKVNNAWQIDVEHKGITSLGSFGRAPQGEFVQIGPDKYGARFEQKYASAETVGADIVLITDLADRFEVVLNVQTAASHLNSAGKVQWSYTSELEFIPNDNKTYYDIQITTQGTRPVEDTITEFEAVKLYTFTGAAYRIID
jgi:hypothetical protein